MAKLTAPERARIAERYYDRIRTGETVQQIADDVGVTRHTVARIAAKLPAIRRGDYANWQEGQEVPGKGEAA